MDGTLNGLSGQKTNVGNIIMDIKVIILIMVNVLVRVIMLVFVKFVKKLKAELRKFS